MSAATATEFNPDYFKAIFGEDAADWREFIQVNLNTYRNGYSRLKNATEHKNLDEIKEAGLNPSGIRSVLEELDQSIGTANDRIQELETQVYDLEKQVRDLESSLQEATSAREQQGN